MLGLFLVQLFAVGSPLYFVFNYNWVKVFFRIKWIIPMPGP